MEACAEELMPRLGAGLATSKKSGLVESRTELTRPLHGGKLPSIPRPPWLVLIDCATLPRPPQAIRGGVNYWPVPVCISDGAGPKAARPMTSERTAGKAWEPQDLYFLESALARGVALTDIAGFLGRSEEEVRAKAKTLE